MERGKYPYHAWWIWAVYLVLFLVAVPWYWPADSRQVLFGFPVWVLVSVFATFLLSCFTAWLFLARWPEGEGEEKSGN